MQHVTDNDLVLHYYGETEGTVPDHLDQCPDCERRFATLRQTLDGVSLSVPARLPGYEDQVWRRLCPKLPPRQTFWASFPAWAAAIAACLVLAFFVGRYNSGTPPVALSGGARAGAVRERVLIVAVGSHLERSRMVLAELVNARPDQGAAESLLEENRLYRQTAMATGDRQVASLLEDLERVLLEVAHTPETASPSQLQSLRERIEAQGLVFKINVFESQLQRRVAKPSADSL